MNDRKKVLIIDDEVELCHLLKSYFERKEYEVVITHTLKDGRDKLQSFNPDILFLDNNLPDGSGWQMAPQIALEHPTVLITLFSGYYPKVPPMPANAKYTVIEKPISFADIDKNLQALMQDTAQS